MGRLLTGLAGALGLAWLWRFLRREHAQQQAPPAPGPDPAEAHAEELRAKLAEARETADDRDDFDAAEGQPVDEVERPPAAPEPAAPEAPPAEQTLSLDERRRAIHEKAQQALGEMNRPGDGE